MSQDCPRNFTSSSAAQTLLWAGHTPESAEAGHTTRGIRGGASKQGHHRRRHITTTLGRGGAAEGGGPCRRTARRKATSGPFQGRLEKEGRSSEVWKLDDQGEALRCPARSPISWVETELSVLNEAGKLRKLKQHQQQLFQYHKLDCNNNTTRRKKTKKTTFLRGFYNEVISRKGIFMPSISHPLRA